MVMGSIPELEVLEDVQSAEKKGGGPRQSIAAASDLFADLQAEEEDEVRLDTRYFRVKPA